MKKTITLLITVLLMISICACGKAVPEEKEEATPAEAPAPVETPAQADEAAAEELCAILNGLFSNYRPATAGSSLALAHSAGELLDWYEKSGSSENIALAASLFAAAKPDYAEAEGEPLNAVYGMAKTVCEPDGDGMVADSGYERQSDAWCSEHTEAFFTELFAALEAAEKVG